MRTYIKIYYDYFGYRANEWISCEYCGGTAVNIHHLTPRSLDKSRINQIENLAAVCMECHNKAGASKSFNDELRDRHFRNLLKSKKDNERIILYPKQK